MRRIVWRMSSAADGGALERATHISYDLRTRMSSSSRTPASSNHLDALSNGINISA